MIEFLAALAVTIAATGLMTLAAIGAERLADRQERKAEERRRT